MSDTFQDKDYNYGNNDVEEYKDETDSRQDKSGIRDLGMVKKFFLLS
jgi:hypothetical protein